MGETTPIVLEEVPYRLPDEDFLALVSKRNTGPDGKPLDPTLLRRMSHEICVRCQEDYRVKFKGKPFGIKCEGIYSEQDFVEVADITGESYENVREILDIPYWANRHVKIPNTDGDLVPFEARDYQKESLWCTARFIVDRWGRGLGKTQTSIIRELHASTTRKRYNILVACPAKAQAQKWFDEINQTVQADPGLRASLVQTRQQPYYTFRFANGSTINIFTTGSASGRDADVVRSQSPRRVCIDEQDLLNPGDYKAILPLLRRYPDSEFHGMSTPTGKRETFWQMCTEFPDYKSLHFPINRHPQFSEEYEAACRREARTEINYLHEFEAEFGEQEGGVFKSVYVDAARHEPFRYQDCKFSNGKRYYIGVDWNGGGTGTRMRVVEYDPKTAMRKCVDHTAIDKSQLEAISELRKLNRKWHAEGIFIDQGFGYVQDELIRLLGGGATGVGADILNKMGLQPENRDDLNLAKIVRAIDFGANIETNSLVPNRGNTILQQKAELERPTKPFLVEGAQMVIEMGLFQFSPDDKLLDEQLRAYRVKTYSRHGWANTYESRVGDHDLDALMLALLGIELKYGLTKIPDKRPVATGLAYAPSFGSGVPHTPGQKQELPQTAREAAQSKGNIPNRTVLKTAGQPRSVVSKDIYGNTQGIVTSNPTPRQAVGLRQTPNTPMQAGPGVPSRTGMFGSGGRGGGRGRGLFR